MKAHELAKKLLEGPDLPVFYEAAPFGHAQEVQHVHEKERKKEKTTKAGGLLEYTDGSRDSNYLLLDSGIPII